MQHYNHFHYNIRRDDYAKSNIIKESKTNESENINENNTLEKKFSFLSTKDKGKVRKEKRKKRKNYYSLEKKTKIEKKLSKKFQSNFDQVKQTICKQIYKYENKMEKLDLQVKNNRLQALKYIQDKYGKEYKIDCINCLSISLNTYNNKENENDSTTPRKKSKIGKKKKRTNSHLICRNCNFKICRTCINKDPDLYLECGASTPNTSSCSFGLCTECIHSANKHMILIKNDTYICQTKSCISKALL